MQNRVDVDDVAFFLIGVLLLTFWCNWRVAQINGYVNGDLEMTNIDFMSTAKADHTGSDFK